MSIKILTITNCSGNINKSFNWINGEVHKESKAQVFNASFQENEFQTLEDFDTHLNNLAPNQAISLGRSKHGLTQGSLLTKGNEDLATSTISRSNDYMALQNGLQLCLGDVDPDAQMNDLLKSFNSPDKVFEAITQLHGDLFIGTSARSGFGSSNGIIDTQTNEPVYESNSMHVYWTLLNADEKSLDRYVEFLKRRAVLKNYWYLKIHKDGSTSFRILLDLSVIKSMQSRFAFEALASVGEGLAQIKPVSTFYNTENGLIPFDLSKVSYKNLPDWRVVFEQAKRDNKEKIEAVKKQYRADKLIELVQSYKLSEGEAALIIDEYLSKSTISASMILKAGDNNPYRAHSFLKQDVKYWEVYDIFDYKKGLGKTKLNVKNIFDANIYTYLRGGVTYAISFTLDEILLVLNGLDYSKENISNTLYALIEYVVNNAFKEEDVALIVDLLKDKKCSFEFEKYYYKAFIDFTVHQKMSDYAFMMMDGKTGLMKTIEDGDLTLYPQKGVSDKFLNQNFYTKNPDQLDKTIMTDVVKYWMRSKHRRDYESVVFTDEEVVDKTAYNLFKGFAYTPINHEDVDIQILFDLILSVICDGDEFFYNVTLAYIAQMIQDPMNKLGTALVIYGEKRIGKGTFIKLVGDLIGSNHYFQTSQADKVFGRFNVQLLRSVLVYLNEAFWSGDKSAEGRIKSLITDEDMSYEIKGGAIFGGKNVTRLILDSNDKYIVPATADEGRYICLNASSCKKGNREFLGAANDLRKNQKAMEKIMYFFMNFDYKPYEHHLREAPKNAFLVEQIVQNFTKIQEWWFRNLQEGNIYKANYVLDVDGIKISNEAFWESFKEFHKGKTQYEKQQSFYSDLKELLDGVVVKNTVKVSAGVTGKIIAPLSRCREAFTQKYLVSDFDDVLGWSQAYNPNMPLPIVFGA